MTDWGPFLRSARHQRGWSQVRACEEMRQHTPIVLPSVISLLRSWKRWEKGHHPGRFYDEILHRMFPPNKRNRANENGYPAALPPIPDAPHPALE